MKYFWEKEELDEYYLVYSISEWDSKNGGKSFGRSLMVLLQDRMKSIPFELEWAQFGHANFNCRLIYKEHNYHIGI